MRVASASDLLCCGLTMDPPLSEYCLVGRRRALWYCGSCNTYRDADGRAVDPAEMERRALDVRTEPERRRA